jgi:hypothetical protein
MLLVPLVLRLGGGDPSRGRPVFTAPLARLPRVDGFEQRDERKGYQNNGYWQA